MSVTRTWYRGTRDVSSELQLHHWMIPNGGPIGRMVPNAIKNQPWNLMPLAKEMHLAVHGKGPEALGTAGRLYYGTPQWAKGVAGSTATRVVQTAGGSCK